MNNKTNINYSTASLHSRAVVIGSTNLHCRWFSWLVLCISLSFGLGLTYDVQAGSRRSSCGGDGQRECNVWEAFPSCDSGLKASAGKCVSTACGALNQRPCTIAERVPSCNSGLAEDFIKNKCVEDAVGKFVEKTVNDAGAAIISAGETVGKFSAAQGKKAIDETKKGVAAAGKAIEGAAATVYKEAAETFLGQIKTPLENMAKAWKDSKSRDPIAFDALVKAVQAGDGPKTEAALKKVLHGMFVSNNSPFHLIVKDFKDKNAGSLLVVFGAGAGAGITLEGDIGIAIDIDYLIFLGKADKSKGFQGPIASIFTAIGLQAGPAAGGDIDVMIGYHVANPDGVNGPSMDVALEIKAKVGGGIGVGFDVTNVPWMANTAGIGLGGGAKLGLSAGPSYAVLLGQLCGNGTFKALARECPTATASAGTTGTSSGSSMERGMDRQGSDYRNFVPATADPAQCQTACGNEARCKAWTYVLPTSGGPRCFLKDPAPNPRSNACCTSGLKPSSVTTGTGTDTGGTASTLRNACTPTAVTPMHGGAWTIKKFELKDVQNNVVFSNTETNNAMIYEDFTSKTIQANPGAVLSYAVTSSGNGPTDIWIDLNNDGTFDNNAGERVVHNTVASNKQGSLTIPTTLITGVYRMRVRVVPNYTPDPCKANKWSQVEDYTLQIGGSL